MSCWTVPTRLNRTSRPGSPWRAPRSSRMSIRNRGCWLPAWRAFGASLRLRAVLIYRADSARPDAPPDLCGLFLVERASNVFGLPVPLVRTWAHLHSFLGTPLVRAGAESTCFDALFDWLARDQAGAPLFQLTDYGSDGPLERHLMACLAKRGLSMYVARSYQPGDAASRDGRRVRAGAGDVQPAIARSFAGSGAGWRRPAGSRSVSSTNTATCRRGSGSSSTWSAGAGRVRKGRRSEAIPCSETTSSASREPRTTAAG